LLGLGALAPIMAATALILTATSLAGSYVDNRVTSVFSRITAIILAALSIQYIIDGLPALGVITATG
jgi:multiple antibiotic resistance protein